MELLQDPDNSVSLLLLLLSSQRRSVEIHPRSYCQWELDLALSPGISSRAHLPWDSLDPHSTTGSPTYLFLMLYLWNTTSKFSLCLQFYLTSVGLALLGFLDVSPLGHDIGSALVFQSEISTKGKKTHLNPSACKGLLNNIGSAQALRFLRNTETFLQKKFSLLQELRVIIHLQSSW